MEILEVTISDCERAESDDTASFGGLLTKSRNKLEALILF